MKATQAEISKVSKAIKASMVDVGLSLPEYIDICREDGHVSFERMSWDSLYLADQHNPGLIKSLYSAGHIDRTIDTLLRKVYDQ